MKKAGLVEKAIMVVWTKWAAGEMLEFWYLTFHYSHWVYHIYPYLYVYIYISIYISAYIHLFIWICLWILAGSAVAVLTLGAPDCIGEIDCIWEIANRWQIENLHWWPSTQWLVDQWTSEPVKGKGYVYGKSIDSGSWCLGGHSPSIWL